MQPDDPPRPKPSPPAGFAKRADVQLALEAGFSPGEIAYMLDIPTNTLVDGEDHGLHGSTIGRKPV